jgi:hypothetical protein
LAYACRRFAEMSLSSPKDWPNSRLIAECLNGNQQAWHMLVERYKNLIYSVPLKYGAPPQDAADIFQAVCLDLFNELPRIRDADAIQAGWCASPAISVITGSGTRRRILRNGMRAGWRTSARMVRRPRRCSLACRGSKLCATRSSSCLRAAGK